MADARVTMTVADGVADVRLARPDKLNALDPAMFEELAATIDALGARGDVRCVLLSGEGRAFCAGLDMASMAAGGGGVALGPRTHGIANLFQHVAWGWRALPMPVVAAIRGMALGGGLQIAAGACVRIAEPGARFSIREAHWGIAPDMGGFALWRGTVRDDVLRELAYTAREVGAAEAVAHGFVTRLADDPLAEATALAREIAGRSPAAVRAIKRLANAAAEADSGAILAAESAEQAALLGSAEQTEALRANLEKRAPVWAHSYPPPPGGGGARSATEGEDSGSTTGS